MQPMPKLARKSNFQGEWKDEGGQTTNKFWSRHSRANFKSLERR